MMKRKPIIWLAVAAIGALGVALCLWLILSSWIPARGKTLLIQHLKQHTAFDMTMDDARVEPFQGVVLKNVKLYNRATQELWAEAATMQVQVGWLSLILRRRLALRAHAALSVPCQTELTATGTVNLRTNAVSLDVRTSAMELRDITPPLRQRLPPSLIDGTVRLALHITQEPAQPPTISGRIMGTSLAWMSPPVRLQADLTLSGQATAPRQSKEPWEIQSIVTLRNGTAEGLPTIQIISQLEGTAQLTQSRLEIEELTGTVLGSRWRLEGTVAPLSRPSLEILINSHADIAKLSTALNPLHEAWQLAGLANVRAVCRGPLLDTNIPSHAPLPFDCLANAKLQHNTLTGSRLVSPITQISGELDYDALTQRLSIAQLQGRLLEETLLAHGEITLAAPVNVSLDARGNIPLALMRGWLPQDAPVGALRGSALTELRVQGPIAQLKYIGRAELKDVGIGFTSWHHTVEHVEGVVHFATEDIRAERLSLMIDGQPVTLTATLRLGAAPKIIATALVPQGELSAAIRFTPEDVIIDESRLSLAHSRVQVTGTHGRVNGRPSTLRLIGAIELSELSHLPFVPLPALEAWKMQGLAMVEAHFEGRFDNWRGALIQGRIRADHLSVREIPFDRIVCDFEQTNHVLRVRIPTAFAADGKLAAELTIEQHEKTQDYLLQTDLVGLQLAKLTEAIPAWRARSVTGSASAHAMLSGTWEARSSWRAQGWLNAQGERLADIPLFDRLFRGGIFEPLADWLGLETLRRAEITQVSLRFRLAQERLSTEDLRLAGVASNAAVVIYGRGSLGLDQTIDLTIEPELSEQIIAQARVLSGASSVLKAAGLIERFFKLVRYHVTGTLKEPKARFEFTPQDVLKQVLGASAGELLQNLFGPR
jgi:hypothetical protein